ncbi:hypothetical protein [Iningainema tapete]|uniref:Uncharacterized protein n=1 Tax=Iningainema tapete BLCC-T55 TaxID=2748662 RepID=A0A8J6XLT2_9CYAN|nr:hypothetical protein [Iningainema tapete]MBD2775181.1 hypothetical protein [Iningainema tapete BLCC-T55]
MQANDDRPKLATAEENRKRNVENVNSRLGSPSSQSSTDGHDSNQISNPNSTRRDSLGEEDIGGGQGSAGKIASQLRDLQKAHLAFLDDRRKSLESQLAADTEHRNQIIETIQHLEKQVLELLGEQEVESE